MSAPITGSLPGYARSTTADHRPLERNPLRYLLEYASVSLAYYLTARFGLSLGLTTEQITAVWAPTGIALAAVLLLGYRIWPAITLAAFAANAVSHEPIHTAAIIGVGNTLEALAGGFLLRRLVAFDPRLQRIKDVVGLALLGGLFCTTISASIGVSSLNAAGLLSPEVVARSWLKWWLGDAMGALIVTPLLLTWGCTPVRYAVRQRGLELVLIVLGLSTASWLIFSMPGDQAVRLKFLVFPFFVWSALRFEQRITAALIALVAVLAISAATQSATIVEPGALDIDLLVHQTFMGVVCVTSLSLGAAIAERRRVEEERQELLRRESAAREESQHFLAELAAYRDRLEQLIAERTEALSASMQQLRRSERLASLGTLAAGIAHEINNPLNNILLSAENALTLDSTESKDAALKVIKQEAQRGGRIVRNVLDFSRERNTDKTAADLNEVVCRAAEFAKTALNQSDVKIILELEPSLPLILMNVTEMEQLITNLIRNAAEATKSSVEILLRTQRDHASACLIVRDNGPGIPREHLGRIFDPFFSTRIGSGGTGLGLSICHSIVAGHGGSIDVQSQSGQGATFTIRLPAISVKTVPAS